MAGPTQALVSLHGAGRNDTYGAALLDVAQDHLLWMLDQHGLFESDELVFKGGTSLRKCRLGNAGRFSTDLDFACPDEGTVLDVCAAIDGQSVGGFVFSLGRASDDGRHWDMRVEHTELGMPDVGASVEFARRPLAMAPERLPFLALRVHKSYGFDLPTLPVIAEAEACAEKLARYRRVALGRDLYDLDQFAGRHIAEPVVRRLWVLKVWGDVVDDGRGNRPVDPDDVLQPRRAQNFRPDSLGKLTQPVDLPSWERHVRARFAFLADLDDDELRWARCDERDRAEVERATAAGGFP
ncbi:MAG: nucleotidyl transferase AbiEii/AbiGii toxin family protein [Acidimicrobiia bacterium]|nr:nucleotidyl transferase AbiEii/AbiGii toxin family protein [Acidimicrobiia bacterium]